MGKQDIAVVMPTVDRSPEPNYLRQTLDRLRESGVDCVVYILNSRTDASWIDLPDKGEIVMSPEDRSLCANENAANALRVGAQCDCEWVLFVEDDIDVCANFLESVGSWLDNNSTSLCPVYVFGCVAPEIEQTVTDGRELWECPLDRFYGTQCFAIRRDDALDLAKYLEDHCYDRQPDGTEYDHLMADWAKAKGIEYFIASCPSFVQHIGRRSVINPRPETHIFKSWPGREWAYNGECEVVGNIDSLTVLTPFRNSRPYLRRYFEQLVNLNYELGPGCTIRIVAVEGDSVDGTRELLQQFCEEYGLYLTIIPVDHGHGVFSSTETVQRMQVMSDIMNTALGNVRDTDDMVLWVMSDVTWSADTLADMILSTKRHRDGFDILSPMTMRYGNFYDTWAYRKDGVRFSNYKPYHDGIGNEYITEVDSAGTCLVMSASIASNYRADDTEAVSFCDNVRAAGYRIGVGLKWTVEHPAMDIRPVKNDKPSILWIGDSCIASGFAKCTDAVCGELYSHGWDVNVLALNYFGDPHDKPYNIYPAKQPLDGGHDLFGVDRLPKLVHRLKPDCIVILNDTWNMEAYIQSLAHWRMVDQAVVGWLAVDAENQRGELLNGLSHVVTWTEFAQEELRKRGCQVDMSVVPLGVDLDLFSPRDKVKARRKLCPTVPGDAFIVGVVGRNQPRKRLDLTVEYFAHWIKQYGIDDAWLCIHTAPTGERGCDVVSLVNYHSISNRVILSQPHIGRGIDECNMADMYSAFDVFLTTTQGEGWGLCTLEAMACGVPVICPDYSGLGSWVGDAALKVPCTSTALTAPLNATPYTVGGVPDRGATVDALQMMYKDFSQVRDRCRDRGLELASQLTWGRTAEQFRQVLEGVLGYESTVKLQAVAGG